MLVCLHCCVGCIIPANLYLVICFRNEGLSCGWARRWTIRTRNLIVGIFFLFFVIVEFVHKGILVVKECCHVLVGKLLQQVVEVDFGFVGSIGGNVDLNRSIGGSLWFVDSASGWSHGGTRRRPRGTRRAISNGLRVVLLLVVLLLVPFRVSRQHGMFRVLSLVLEPILVLGFLIVPFLGLQVPILPVARLRVVVLILKDNNGLSFS